VELGKHQPILSKPKTNRKGRKSQLAIEYSYKVRDQSPDKWVFWVHASNTARFEESYRNIAERAKIPGWDDPKVNILRLVTNWLRDEANGQWLMIVDNADNILLSSTTRENEVDDSSPGDSVDYLSEFLPQSQNGSILVTSRNRDIAYRITGDDSDIIVVDPMGEEVAVKLLRKKLHGNVSEDDARKLVRALDYMPLAISQAAAFITHRTPHTSVSTYLQDLQKSDVDRARLLNRNISDTRRDGRASNSIIATWQISFENICTDRPSASQLLSLMSLFDRQGIPKWLLNRHYQEEEKEEDFEDDIYTLCSYSLIRTSADGTEFEMHQLVQFSTKAWLELRNQLENWKERFIIIMDKEFPDGRYETWSTCQKLFPHVERTLAYRPAKQEYLTRWASILFDAAWYADAKGNYNVVEKMIKEAMNAYELSLGQEHQNTLASIAFLAITYRRQGRWKEAEELEVQVMETSLRLHGAEHPNTLNSINNLASTYRRQGRWKEAEELGVQVMETRNMVLGAEHPSTLLSLHNLAFTWKGQGRDAEAIKLMENCARLQASALGVDHPRTVASAAALVSWQEEDSDIVASGIEALAVKP